MLKMHTRTHQAVRRSEGDGQEARGDGKHGERKKMAASILIKCSILFRQIIGIVQNMPPRGGRGKRRRVAPIRLTEVEPEDTEVLNTNEVDSPVENVMPEAVPSPPRRRKPTRSRKDSADEDVEEQEPGHTRAQHAGDEQVRSAQASSEPAESLVIDDGEDEPVTMMTTQDQESDKDSVSENEDEEQAQEDDADAEQTSNFGRCRCIDERNEPCWRMRRGVRF